MLLCTVSIIRVSGSSAHEDSIIEDTYHAAGEGAASNAREHSACDESIEGTVAVGEDDPGDDHGNTEKNRSRLGPDWNRKDTISSRTGQDATKGIDVLLQPV